MLVRVATHLAEVLQCSTSLLSVVAAHVEIAKKRLRRTGDRATLDCLDTSLVFLDSAQVVLADLLTHATQDQVREALDLPGEFTRRIAKAG